MSHKSEKRLSNRALVEHLVNAPGDDPLWIEFVGRFQERLRVSVARIYQLEARRNPDLDTGSVLETAEDLTQEVFLKLLESKRRALSRFRGRTEHSIVTYLSAIAVNLVRDHFRRLRALKRPRASLSLSRVSTAPSSPEEEGGEGASFESTLVCDAFGPEGYVAAGEFHERIQDALDALAERRSSQRDRLVFRLYFVEGLTISEIASIGAVRLSQSGVEKCIRRIRETLKSRLSEGGSATGNTS